MAPTTNSWMEENQVGIDDSRLTSSSSRGGQLHEQQRAEHPRRVVIGDV